MEQRDENYWLTARVTYLKGLKSRSDQQELLVLLAEKTARTPQDDKKLAALVRAEKASVRAAKARQEAANLINAERKAAAEAERKARDHELYQAAGLLSLAGLVDKKTGKPTMDRGQLLGALLGLAKVSQDDPRRADWKRAGDALLSEKE
jgi:predicted ATP-dependent protease